MCNVCCEDWSAKVVRTECPYCKFATCQKCIKTYMMESFNDPKCMHPDCKKVWTIDHLFTIVPKPFITGQYKKHRESVLYNREVAMMQATQPYVEALNLKKKVMEQIEEITKKMSTLQRKREKLMGTLRRIDYEEPFPSSSKHASKAVQQYAGRCGNDTCKGFVNNKTYVCGICESKYCEKCFAIKDADAAAVHECNPDDVKTFEKLRQDSKPCPSCVTLVFKVSGCSMMFCTQCNTAWDWFTLMITRDENRIHNPHYFEWRAANPLQQGAGANGAPLDCAENLTNREVVWACTDLCKLDRMHVLDMWGLVVHVSHEHLTRFQEPHIERAFDRNLDLRIRYLNNEIDEKHLKSIIHKREKSGNKKREIYQILQMFITVSRELVMAFCLATTKNVPELKVQFKNIVDFADQALEKVSARYNCVTHSIQAMVDARMSKNF